MKTPVIFNNTLFMNFAYYGAFIYLFIGLGDALIPSILYAIVFDYLVSCFWQKRICVYDDHVDILYYTRMFRRSKTLHFNEIKRVSIALGGIEEIRIWKKCSFRCIMMEVDDSETIKPALTLLFDGGIPVKIRGSLEKKLLYKPDSMDI